MNEKFKESLRNNFGYIVAFIISCIYVLSSFITIDKTGKSLYRIIADGAMAFVFGFCLSKIFELQGMRNAEKEDRMKKTLFLHEEWVLKISPYIDRLDPWCDKMNLENLKKQRTRILSSAGLGYSSCFDDNGNALPYKPLYDPSSGKKLYKIECKRAKAYEKAVGIRVSTLFGCDLTSNGKKSDDPFDFGRNKLEYEKQMSKKQAIMKIISSAIFGYYGVKLLDSFSYASLIWTCLQIAVFLLTGTIKMYSAYNFMTDEYRTGIIKKIDLLQQFVSSLEEVGTVNIESEVKNDKEQLNDKKQSVDKKHTIDKKQLDDPKNSRIPGS